MLCLSLVGGDSKWESAIAGGKDKNDAPKVAKSIPKPTRKSSRGAVRQIYEEAPIVDEEEEDDEEEEEEEEEDEEEEDEEEEDEEGGGGGG